MRYELNIDLALLRKQKAALLGLIGKDPDHTLWGLVELLDAVQDQAVDVHGRPEHEVFGAMVES